MTHRRLFLWLFTISTALLIMAWGVSLFRQPMALVFMPGREFSLSLCPGFLRLEVESEAWKITHGRGMIFTKSRTVSSPHLGVWVWNRESSTARKSISTHRTSPPLAITDVRSHRISFPLWAPWLIFTGGTFVVCRWLEKRSAAGREKMLAESAALDSVAGDPA
ncbi:MAG: hypothetical protein EOP88_12560 [Verrucomicrobiaceae bacterium]|nr:MAG: hypothetical protein EOP88_12560 [Verrucomicrobiaceae bacterium]